MRERDTGCNVCEQQEPQRSGRRQTAAFINHTVAVDQQRVVKYMINENNFNSAL